MRSGSWSSWVLGCVLWVGCGDEGGGAAETDTDAASTGTTNGGVTDGSSAESTAGTQTTQTDETGETMTETVGDTESSSGGDESSGGETTGGAMSVCERWTMDRADLSEGTWSGSVETCEPGDISAEGRENALRVMNLYRWLADLPPVTTSAERDAMAQACALMMHANGQLSHSPPKSWACYSGDGASGAGSSNISPTPGVEGVDLYMVDPGNPTTMGHRRWILSNNIGPTGLGSTSDYSCMWTLQGSGDAGKEWTAWPPPGTFPLQAVQPSWSSIDETGWTIQSDPIDLSAAQVSITRDGEDLPVVVTSLQGGYGSASAISMIPQGWTTTVGTYHVEVTGIASPLSYDVEVEDCG